MDNTRLQRAQSAPALEERVSVSMLILERLDSIERRFDRLETRVDGPYGASSWAPWRPSSWGRGRRG